MSRSPVSPGNVLVRHKDSKKLDELEARVLQLQIDALRKAVEDRENRLRSLEETQTRFNFLLYLTMGGGLMGLINLIGLAYLIVTAEK